MWAAAGAVDDLGVRAVVTEGVVFVGAVWAERPVFKGGVSAVPGHISDDGVAWTAMETAVEGVVQARMVGLFDFAEAVTADGEVRRDGWAGVTGCRQQQASGVEPRKLARGKIGGLSNVKRAKGWFDSLVVS